MDLIGHIDDGLDQSLVPLTNRTSKGRTRCERASTINLRARRLVDELTRRARPVVVSCRSLRKQIIQDLAIELQGDLLGQDLGELHLSIEAVVSIQILRQLRRPSSTQLTGVGHNRHALDLDVDLRNRRRRAGTEIRLEGRNNERVAGVGRTIECSIQRFGDLDSSSSTFINRPRHDHQHTGVRIAGLDQTIWRPRRPIPRTDLVQATNVSRCAALNRLPLGIVSDILVPKLGRNRKFLHQGQISVTELGCASLETDNDRLINSLSRGAAGAGVALNRGGELRIELNEPCIGASRDQLITNGERAGIAKRAGRQKRNNRRCLVNTRVARTRQVVLAAHTERTGSNTLARRAVVDRRSRTVRSGAGVAREITSIGVIQIEEQTRGKAHRLDRNQIIGNQTAEYSADDRKRDIGKTAKITGRCLTGIASRNGRGLFQDLAGLTLQKSSHVLTLNAIETAKQTSSAPLCDQLLVLGTHVACANPLSQHFKIECRHFFSL